MGQIRRKETFGIINVEEEKEPISYCPECRENDVQSTLKPRIYMPGETIPHRSERENWRQCWTCGLLVPIYELKKESKLKDIVEVSDNPWDHGQHITGLGNKSNPRKLCDSQKKMKRLKEQIEKEKDPEVKAELKKEILLR